ncbi:MAG: hypothetical protein KAJ95_06480 [Gammaproteobacteria bacterium]|nr:hypothetical protein [Gammaproteobacteria bacterium]
MTLENDNPPSEAVTTETANKNSIQISTLIYPLYQSLFWMRLFAACLIFYGALITVTGIGVLVAWVPMWIGVLLLLVAKSISQAYTNNNEQALNLTLSRLKTIFTILGLSSVALIVATFYFLKYAFEKSLF